MQTGLPFPGSHGVILANGLKPAAALTAAQSASAAGEILTYPAKDGKMVMAIFAFGPITASTAASLVLQGSNDDTPTQAGTWTDVVGADGTSLVQLSTDKLLTTPAIPGNVSYANRTVCASFRSDAFPYKHFRWRLKTLTGTSIWYTQTWLVTNLRSIPSVTKDEIYALAHHQDYVGRT